VPVPVSVPVRIRSSASGAERLDGREFKGRSCRSSRRQAFNRPSTQGSGVPPPLILTLALTPELLIRFPENFSKVPQTSADSGILELMKFLVTGMSDLKLRLLDRIVQSRSSAQPDSNAPGGSTELHKKIICQAVEDRICKRLDLATRPDLTDREATDALCLLLKIVRRNGLPAQFSTSEIALLARGARSGCNAARR